MFFPKSIYLWKYDFKRLRTGVWLWQVLENKCWEWTEEAYSRSTDEGREAPEAEELTQSATAGGWHTGDSKERLHGKHQRPRLMPLLW